MSEIFQWSDEFSVGIPEIDIQHKALFDLGNLLNDAIRSRRGSAACLDILRQLVDYTRIHFALEESLMRVANYRGFDDHKALHVQLIDEVEVLQQKVEAGKAAISFELLQFLRLWLTKHIMNSDQEYAGHFRSKGFKDFGAWNEEVKTTMKKRQWWKFW